MRAVTRHELVIEALPLTQFIAVLSDPVMRSLSQYLHDRKLASFDADVFHRHVLGGINNFRVCLQPPSCTCFWNDQVWTRRPRGWRNGYRTLRKTPLLVLDVDEAKKS